MMHDSKYDFGNGSINHFFHMINQLGSYLFIHSDDYGRSCAIKQKKRISFMYPSMTHATGVLIRFILLFKTEHGDYANDIMIANSLEDVQLASVSNDDLTKSKTLLSSLNFSIYDRLIDEMGIFKRDKRHEMIAISANGQKFVTSIETCSEDVCQYQYFKMKIPVKKSLFLKAICVSLHSDVQFSVNEIYEIIMGSFVLFMDNGQMIQRSVCQQLFGNENIYDQLNRIFVSKTRSSQSDQTAFICSFSTQYNDFIDNIKPTLYLHMIDSRGNILLASNIRKEESSLPAYTMSLNILFIYERCHITLSSSSILENHEQLYKIYKDPFSEKYLLVVDIHFDDILYDVQNRKNGAKISNDMIVDKIIGILKCNFLSLSCVQKLVLRFKSIDLAIDLNLRLSHDIDIYLNACKLVEGVVLPSNIKMLNMVYSHVLTDLELPCTLEEIIIKHSEIAEGKILEIDKSCKIINIEQVTGKVSIPHLEQNFWFKLSNSYSIVVKNNTSSLIEELEMHNASFLGNIIIIPPSIKTLTLSNVKLGSKAILKIFNDITSIKLHNFTGSVQLVDVNTGKDITIEIKSGSVELLKTNDSAKPNKFVLRSASLPENFIFNENITEIEMSDIKMQCGDFVEFSKNVQSVYLKNICGTVLFTCVGCLEKVVWLDCKRFNSNIFREFDTMILNVEDSLFDKNRMLLSSKYFCNNTIILKPAVKIFSFTNIMVPDQYILPIHGDFEKITLSGCIGKFTIPHIFKDGAATVQISGEKNILRIVKTSTGSYNIKLKT
ncbi:putative LRR containing protein [Trachipleistophora hominis]|uniref:Putative LRR containing protein n=1 Tax=Trachipleistophora hominis TaxID=72359 RepID=L7JRA8_TRAHO|nr:putative LRR containing protein [Trachipleistophora hominis]